MLKYQAVRLCKVTFQVVLLQPMTVLHRLGLCGLSRWSWLD